MTHAPRAIASDETRQRGQNAAWDALVPTMSERMWLAVVIEAARSLGWLCFHVHDSRHSAAGFPDVLCVRRDRIACLELKRERRSDLTEAQREWCDALEQAGCEVYRPVRPSDYDAILEVLR